MIMWCLHNRLFYSWNDIVDVFNNFFIKKPDLFLNFSVYTLKQ